MSVPLLRVSSVACSHCVRTLAPRNGACGAKRWTIGSADLPPHDALVTMLVPASTT